MPALIRVFCLLSVLFSTLSACSDSSSSASDTQVQGRTSSLGTPFAVIEGNAGKRSNLPITFTSPVSGTISYETFSVTAAQKSDFIPLIGEIDLVAGDEYTIIISVQGDDEIEGDELIGLSLKQDGKLIDEYFGLILNDDLPKLDITTTAVLEGDTGTSLLRFVFELQENTVDPYTFSITTPMVDIASNNPAEGIFYAVPGIDFQAINQPITFTKDLLSISIDVVVNSDNVIELDELVAIQAGTFNDAEREALLSSLGQVIGEQGLGEITANGIIRTDDSIDINGFDLKSVSGSAKEGNSDDIDNLSWTLVTYTIEVENPDNIIDDQVVQIKLEGLDINIGESGWAMPGLDQDYCANNPSVPLENGQIECSTLSSYPLTAGTEFFDISFYVRADLDVEGENEDIKIIIQNDQGVTFGEFFHSIEEDDYPSIMVSYNTDSAGAGPGVVENFEALIEQGIKVNEGTILTLGLNLEYPQSALYELTYELANDESTAIDSGDYPIVSGEKSGTISIPVGNIEGAKLQINIDDDSEYEGTEKFTLEIDGIGVIPISIIDNDLPELKVESVGENKVLRNDADYTDFSPFTLSEQDTVEAGNTQPDKYYDFNVFFAENKQARTDLNFSYTIDDSFFVNQKEALEELSLDCSYLSSAGSKQKANIAASDPFSENDYRVFINNNEKQPGVTELISKGQSGLSLRIQVNNDLDVECLEFLSLNLILESKENSLDINSLLTVQFEIPNTDKAVLEVSGWSLDEGSSTDSAATTDTAFILSLDQPLVSDINFTLASTDANNCGDDIANVQAATHSFSGESNDLSKTVAVNISQDNVVEPDEICKLSINSVSANSVGVIEVRYIDGRDHAQGIIKNDDLLTITVNTADTAEPEEKDDKVSVGTYTWVKDIAANVEKIAIQVSQQVCDESQDCVEAGDTTLGSPSDVPLTSYEIVIHEGPVGGIGAETVNASVDQVFPVYIIGDSIVENSETLNFVLSKSAGQVYMEDLTNVERSIEISSADTLPVSLEEDTSANTCGDNTDSTAARERDCERIFNVVLDAGVSDQLEDLSVGLSINELNTSNIKLSDSDNGNYIDAIISLKNLETGTQSDPFVQSYPDSNGKIYFNILSGGVVQNPVIKITFNEDSVVETDEKLRLDLVKDTDSSLFGINNGQISHDVLNDDYLDITLTQSDTQELTNLASTPAQPFTYTWDKEIAADVPTIQIAITSNCDSNTAPNIGLNCAELVSGDINSDFIIETGAIDIHTVGAATAIPDSPKKLPVTFIIDNRVEASEVVNLDVSKTGAGFNLTNDQGRGYISGFNNVSGEATAESLALTSTILNDDFLNLQITDVTDGDVNCSGTSGESGTNSCSTYNIAWVNSVDADAGDVTIPLNLPALSSNVRYVAAGGAVNPKDYSLWLGVSEITYTDNQLNLGSDLSANDSTTLKVQIEDDNFVEPVETLTVSLNATGSHYVATINSNTAEEEILSHTIPIDDLLTVTVLGSGTSFNEAGDAQGVANPFTYVTDKPIAPNTPTLEMALTAGSCTDSCATVNSDFTLSDTQTLHTNLSPTSIITTAKNLGLLIKPDNIVENDELINLLLSSQNSDYVQFSGTQDLSYTILNVDELTLAVSEIIGTCTGFDAESGCREFELSWNQEIEGSSVPSINIALSGTFETADTLLSAGVVSNPQDISITANGAGVVQDLTAATTFELTDNGESQTQKQMTFKVELVNDNFVELEESFTLALSKPNNSIIGSITTQNTDWSERLFNITGVGEKFTHIVPVSADTLMVTVVAETDAPEPGDGDGLAVPFTYYTNLNVASNVPVIDLTVGQVVACSADATCAAQGAGNDFTLPAVINLHTANGYTPIVPATNDNPAKGSQSLGVEVLQDNIIEVNELIELSLSVNTEAQEYVSLPASNPQYTIADSDLLDISISELTGADTSCTNFSGEAGCREFLLQWVNELQSGSATLELKETGSNKAVFTESLDPGDLSITTDPQDYNLTASNLIGTDPNINGRAITIEDTDGEDVTRSMKVSININDDIFVEPSEQLSVYFGKPTGENSIGTISDFASTSNLVEYDIPVDDTLTITFIGSGSSGAEPQYDVNGVLVSDTVSKPFSYSTNAPIAANTPTIALNLSNRACDTSPCATKGSDNDFSVEPTTNIHIGSTPDVPGFFKPIKVANLNVTVNDDEIVEAHESIKVRVRESSQFIEDFGNVDNTYTINNNDKTVLSFVTQSAFNGDEGNSGSADVSYSIRSSLAVSSNVGKLFVNLSLDSSSTADSDDVTVPTTLEFKGNSAISAGAIKNFNVAIIGEEIVELDETVIPKITLHTGSSDYTEIDSTESKGATYTITNDDYINLEVIGGTCSELSSITTCAMTEGDTGSTVFTFKPTVAYQTQGIIDPTVSLSAVNTSTASGSDYTFVNAVALDVSVSNVGVTGLEKTFLTITGDKIIERNENVILTASIPPYVALNFPSGFIIRNDDYVAVSSKNYMGLNQVDKLQEDGALKLEFCVPSGYTYQNQNGLSDITLTVTPTVSGTDTDFYKKATCLDINLLSDDAAVVTCDLASMSVERLISLDGKTTGECATLDLMTASTDLVADQNVWFELAYATSDERCEGTCLEGHTIAVLNNDLISTLDTGLNECIQSGINKRWDVRCDDATYAPTGNYLKQDAAETDFYPDLSYTFIDADSAAVTAKPASGEACVQDNSTGLIWSSAIESNTTTNDYTINYSGDDTAQTSWDCGIQNSGSKTWQLPTVQELMSIMDLNPVSKSKPLNENRIFDFKKTGSNYYNANARYWSSDLCTISAANDGAWTVDFITGHFVCENISSETNAKMHVYK